MKYAFWEKQELPLKLLQEKILIYLIDSQIEMLLCFRFVTKQFKMHCLKMEHIWVFWQHAVLSDQTDFATFEQKQIDMTRMKRENE